MRGLADHILALVGIAILLLLFFLRMPISFAMFIVGFLGLLMYVSSDAAFQMVVTDIWSQFSSYTLGVIPLYILMGEIVFRTGISEKLFEAAYRWIGHIRGGMAGTTIVASAGFGTICGSNSATAATIGTLALPELKKYNYHEALRTGSIAAGGTLGVIIPPSTVLIVMAIQTQQSVRDLFVASLIPGLMLTLLMILTVIYICQKNPEYGPPGEAFSLQEKLHSLLSVIPIIMLFLFVIGGLYLGLFTPTESGAFGAFGALLLSLVMKKLTWEKFYSAVGSALRSSAMVLMLIVGAMVFSRFITMTRLPIIVSEWIATLAVPTTLILIAILLIYVIGGAIMDALGFLILSIPIFFPTVIQLGYDPLWFAIVLCIVTSLGAITPPVGVNVFVVKGLAPDTSVTTIFRGATWFIVSYVLLVALLITFPEIVLFPVR